MEHRIIFLIVCLALGAAAFTDLRRGRIPNWITISTVVVGLVFHTAMRGAGGITYSAEGLAAGFGSLILIYAIGGLGAGDVKLVAATGSLLGPLGIISALFATAMVGGLCVFGLLVKQLGWPGMVRWIWSWLKTLVLLGGKPPALPSTERRLTLRYAPIFAIGTLMSLTLTYIE